MELLHLTRPESAAHEKTRQHRNRDRRSRASADGPLDLERHILHRMRLHVVCRGAHGPRRTRSFRPGTRAAARRTRAIVRLHPSTRERCVRKSSHRPRAEPSLGIMIASRPGRRRSFRHVRIGLCALPGSVARRALDVVDHDHVQRGLHRRELQSGSLQRGSERSCRPVRSIISRPDLRRQNPGGQLAHRDAVRVGEDHPRFGRVGSRPQYRGLFRCSAEGSRDREPGRPLRGGLQFARTLGVGRPEYRTLQRLGMGVQLQPLLQGPRSAPIRAFAERRPALSLGREVMSFVVAQAQLSLAPMRLVRRLPGCALEAYDETSRDCADVPALISSTTQRGTAPRRCC